MQSFVVVAAVSIHLDVDEIAEAEAYGPADAQTEVKQALKNIGFEVEDVTVYERSLPPAGK